MSATLLCPHCDAPLEGMRGDVAWVRCRACQAMVFGDCGGPKVVCAHESEELCEQMGAVLCEAGLHPLRAADGAQVIKLFDKYNPKAIVVDVGLDKVMTFQVVEHVREVSQGKSKVVLVASVFRKTAYKRTPASLYGADDYVEQHHIPDKLANKVCELIGHTPPQNHDKVLTRRRAIGATQERPDLSGKLRVRALAHSIVADIALYNQREFEKAVEGQAEGLKAALEEGRQLLEQMVDAREYRGRDPIGEAFDAFVDEMRRATR